MRPILGLLPFLLLLGVLTAAAQADTSRTLVTPTDTLTAPGPALDSAAPTGYVMTKSPTTAVLYSIVPGLGQIYNEQYWKAPMFFGVAGFFAYQAIDYHLQYNRQADLVDAADPADPTLTRSRALREFYRDQRDLNIAYFLGVEVLNMIDAYVGAHLFDFNVDDSISSRLYYDPFRNGVGMMMRW